ncbi:MAG: hypothetical protein M3Q18_11860 [Actinomycetota bacterium]|nr:hypothetical protein [Actinomycetota bacterium]
MAVRDYASQTFDNRMGHIPGADGKEKNKLLTPVASEEISISDLFYPGCGSFFQQLITGLMASAVIERLEVVKIEERN